MELYGRFVTPGSYLIVEDTNINGHPVLRDFGPGPMEAVSLFLERSSEFQIDRSREKFFLSFNPGGFLKKVGRNGTTGGGLSREITFIGKDETCQEQLSRIMALETEVKEIKNRNRELHSLLMRIEGSAGWKLLQRFRRIKEALLPVGSFMRRQYERRVQRWRAPV